MLPTPYHRSSSRRHLHYSPRQAPGRALWHALLNHFHLCRALCWLYALRLSRSRALTLDPWPSVKGHARAPSFLSSVYQPKQPREPDDGGVCAPLAVLPVLPILFYSRRCHGEARISLYTGRNRAAPSTTVCAAVFVFRYSARSSFGVVCGVAQSVPSPTGRRVCCFIASTTITITITITVNTSIEGRGASRAWIKKEDILQPMFFVFTACDRRRFSLL